MAFTKPYGLQKIISFAWVTLNPYLYTSRRAEQLSLRITASVSGLIRGDTGEKTAAVTGRAENIILLILLTLLFL
jgi:hypothetical protein